MNQVIKSKCYYFIFYYSPIIIHLTDEEMEDYSERTKQRGAYSMKRTLNDIAGMLLIESAKFNNNIVINF